MKHLVPALILATALSLASTAQAALPGGISGHWYNPDQSGHGLSITLVNPEFAIVIWHVFDNDGNPMTLYVEGKVAGHTIEGTAYAPRGMRFGSFDTAEFEAPQWGEVDLEFESCEQGKLSWDSDDPAFGSGNLPIERLANTLGAECSPPEELPVGLVTGFTTVEGNSKSGMDFEGVVDRDGRLWGLERNQYAIPSPMWVGARLPRAVSAEPVAATETEDVFELQGRAGVVTWTFGHTPHAGVEAEGIWPLFTGGGTLSWSESDSDWTLEWLPDQSASRTLVVPLDADVLAGRYRVPMSDQTPGGSLGWLEIDGQGQVCIDLDLWYEPCYFHGEILPVEHEAGLVEFEIQRGDDPQRPVYSGRGWMAESDSGLELVLVGDDGEDAFALVAEPQ